MTVIQLEGLGTKYKRQDHYFSMKPGWGNGHTETCIKQFCIALTSNRKWHCLTDHLISVFGLHDQKYKADLGKNKTKP